MEDLLIGVFGINRIETTTHNTWVLLASDDVPVTILCPPDSRGGQGVRLASNEQGGRLLGDLDPGGIYHGIGPVFMTMQAADTEAMVFTRLG